MFDFIGGVFQKLGAVIGGALITLGGVFGGSPAPVEPVSTTTPVETIEKASEESEKTVSDEQIPNTPPASIKTQEPVSSATQLPTEQNYYNQASARLQKLKILGSSFEEWLQGRSQQFRQISVNLQPYADYQIENLKIQKANAMVDVISGLLVRVREDKSRWSSLEGLFEQTKTRVPGGFVSKDIYDRIDDPDAYEEDIADVKAEITAELNSL